MRAGATTAATGAAPFSPASPPALFNNSHPPIPLPRARSGTGHTHLQLVVTPGDGGRPAGRWAVAVNRDSGPTRDRRERLGRFKAGDVLAFYISCPPWSGSEGYADKVVVYAAPA